MNSFSDLPSFQKSHNGGSDKTWFRLCHLNIYILFVKIKQHDIITFTSISLSIFALKWIRRMKSTIKLLCLQWRIKVWYGGICSCLKASLFEIGSERHDKAKIMFCRFPQTTSHSTSQLQPISCNHSIMLKRMYWKKVRCNSSKLTNIDATIHDSMRLLHLLKDYLVSWSCTTSYSFCIRLKKILGRCIYVNFSCIRKQHKLTFPIQKKDPKMGKEFKSWF